MGRNKLAIFDDKVKVGEDPSIHSQEVHNWLSLDNDTGRKTFQ